MHQVPKRENPLGCISEYPFSFIKFFEEKIHLCYNELVNKIILQKEVWRVLNF